MKISARDLILKLARIIFLIFSAVLFAFILVKLSPIDPVRAYIGEAKAISPEQRELIRQYWNLDENGFVQFIDWIKNILKGDFGISLIYRMPVLDIILDRFTNSFFMLFIAWFGSILLGYIAGLYMGIRGDGILKKLTLLISSVPSFWLAMIFLLIFSVKLKLTPIGLNIPIGMKMQDASIADRIHHMILPTITLIIINYPSIALHTRNSVIESLNSDYVKYAIARGESEIVKNHVIRNTVVPAISLGFSSFSEIFAGSMLIEQVFSYPGLGKTIVEAATSSDVNLLLGLTFFTSIFVVVGNQIADYLQEKINPKVRS